MVACTARRTRRSSTGRRPQRSGVLAALNMVADTLNLLPRESDTTRRWSPAAWSRDRRGGCSSRAHPRRGRASCRLRVCGSTCSKCP